MGNVVPDRFFWALPPGEEGEEGAEPGADAPDEGVPPKGPRHVH
jgi:hydroxymethylpyrimidine/phosphomethylpyrimidine kinase